VRYIHYLPGGEGIVAILNTVNDVDSMYYLHTEHLGSIYFTINNIRYYKDVETINSQNCSNTFGNRK
jgi:hypothetical protein